MSLIRVMRFVGNRATPEPELFGREGDEILHLAPYPTIDFSKLTDIPNVLLSDFEDKAEPGCLVQPKRTLASSTSDLFFTPSHAWVEPPEPKPLPPESPFEVNLTEALVGWRAWYMPSDLITSWNDGIPWPADAPFEAQCMSKWKHALAPHEHCSCGIYAADRIDRVPISHDDDPSCIIGQVSGWGRYVRGSEGWRAQFAYPKSFHLRSNQAAKVDALRNYHVPIFIEQPVQIYDPSEDGYEHRQDDQNWDLGASAEPNATQGGDADADEDDN